MPIIALAPPAAPVVVRSGRRSPVTWIRHLIARGHENTRREERGGVVCECRICGRVVFHPPGSLLADFCDAIRTFGTFRDEVSA